MAIGDVNSNERGAGARYNDGKDPMALVPVRFWRRAWDGMPTYTREMDFVLGWMQSVQERKVRHGFPYQPADLAQAMLVLDYGRKKYAAWNWSKGQPWSVTIDCALRHIRAIVEAGEDVDLESGHPHMGHVYCNVLFLDWFVQHYPEGDDLIPIEAFPDEE